MKISFGQEDFNPGRVERVRRSVEFLMSTALIDPPGFEVQAI
jgi:hypothetical protein